MVNIALVEDDASAAKTLLRILNAYADKNNHVFSIKTFTSAESFLSESKTSYDIVFLDIELSGMSGMNAAFELRKIDKNVIIIFVTYTAQYAVKGYEVDALYYIIKPVNYESVAFKLKKALAILAANAETTIVLRQTSGLVRISVLNLQYIEISNHKLTYHTDSGAFSAYGSMSEVEDQLKGGGFLRCNNCYLVNARYIASVSGLFVTLLDGTQLQISHPRKKRFLIDLSDWLGEGNS